MDALYSIYTMLADRKHSVPHSSRRFPLPTPLLLAPDRPRTTGPASQMLCGVLYPETRASGDPLAQPRWLGDGPRLIVELEHMCLDTSQFVLVFFEKVRPLFDLVWKFAPAGGRSNGE